MKLSEILLENLGIPFQNKCHLTIINGNGDEIAEILPTNPNDTTNISNNLPADSNLEVNQGFCENNGISVGDKIYKS